MRVGAQCGARAVLVQTVLEAWSILTTLTTLAALTSLIEEPSLERRHRRSRSRETLGRAACAARAPHADACAAAHRAAHRAARGLIEPIEQRLERGVAQAAQQERGAHRGQRGRQATRPLLACVPECAARGRPHAPLLGWVEAQMVELQTHLG
jgi:hypothetical protein